MRRNSVFASTMLWHYSLFCAIQLYSPTAARHADKYDAAVSVYTAYNDLSHHMVKTDAGLNGLYIREITIYIRLYYYINS